MSDLKVRTVQIVNVLEKQDILLKDVTLRLFAANTLDEQWLSGVLQKPEGIDKLESFIGKFCRMQDNFIDKLTPLLLTMLGEISSSAINNLNKLERLNIISNANDWIDMRLIRNKLVHEYFDDISELLAHLILAKELANQLHHSYCKVKTMLNEKENPEGMKLL